MLPNCGSMFIAHAVFIVRLSDLHGMQSYN